MIIPSPTQPLESLDMHVYLNYATMLRALPAAEHPEVRHLVLRLNSHNDDFVASAGRDALNKAIRHYRGVRTLSIIVHSSQLIVKRNDHQSRGSSFLTSLRAADLPDLEALILESSHPICFFGDLQKVLAYAIQVSRNAIFTYHADDPSRKQLASSPTAAYAKLQFIKIAITEDMCGVVSEDRRAPARIGEAETQRARQILRQELAEIDSVTLKLAHCIPLLTFVEIEIVRRTPCLKKSIFRYTSDVHAARGPGDNSSGKLELTEETARSLIANSDGPHGRALSSSP